MVGGASKILEDRLFTAVDSGAEYRDGLRGKASFCHAEQLARLNLER